MLNKNIRLLCAIAMLWGCMTTCRAQNYDVKADTSGIVTNSFWDNWFLQVGADMILLFPVKDVDMETGDGMVHYHHSPKDVFPNGKSLGVSVAAGKWFTPVFGAKLKVNWNNAIIKEKHNIWYHPYGEPGGSHDHGGFLVFSGDMMFNLHNLFCEYKPDRKWNISIGTRAGGWVTLKEGKGGPVLGVGLYNTYRLNNKWKLFGDVNYSFVSSLNDIDSGTDHGGNSYAEFNIGVEMSLSKNNSFHRTSKSARYHDKATVLNPFWDNWFIQAGLGMSLQNPYGTNFTNVFPNGNTLGINFGFGKWFTPGVGLRGGLNWQNSIVRNRSARYLAAMDDPDGELDKRGFFAAYGDMFLNLHNIISGYDRNRRWNAIVFPRMGVTTNYSSSYSECPLLGIGTEQTFAVNDKLKLYADVTYQVMTSGFHDKKFKTPDNGASTNGWLDFNVGIQYDFGKNWWEKPGEKRSTAKWEGNHSWPRFLFNTGASVMVAFGGKSVLKAMIKEERPDHSDNKSFPSGHTAMAFAIARSIDKEFRKSSIWIPVVGYAAATAVGIERIANKHHYWYDVAAGTVVGIGSAELAWWLSDKMFGKGSNLAVGSSGNTVDVTYNF